MMDMYNWASEASPTLRCSIKISHDNYVSVGRYVCRVHAKAELLGPNTRMLIIRSGLLKKTYDTPVVYSTIIC